MTFKFLQKKVNPFFNSTMLLRKTFYDCIYAVCKSKKYPSKKIFFITLLLILWNNIFFIHAHGDEVELTNSSEFFLTLILHKNGTEKDRCFVEINKCKDCQDLGAGITLEPGEEKDIKLLKHTENYDVYVTDKLPTYEYDFTTRSLLKFNSCKPEEKIISNLHDIKTDSFFRLKCKDKQLIITNEFVSAYLWRAIGKGLNGFSSPPKTAQAKPAENALFLKKKVTKEDNKAFFNKISRTPKAYNLQDARINPSSYNYCVIPLHKRLDFVLMPGKSGDFLKNMQAIKKQIFTEDKNTEKKNNTCKCLYNGIIQGWQENSKLDKKHKKVCSCGRDSLNWIYQIDADENAIKAAIRPVEDIKLSVEKALDDDKVAAIIQAINTLSRCNSHKDKSIALVELFTQHFKCYLYQLKTNLNDRVFGFSQHTEEVLRKLIEMINHEKIGGIIAGNLNKKYPDIKCGKIYIKKIKSNLESLGKDRTKPLPEPDFNFEKAEEQQAYDTLKNATADYKEYYLTECKKHESVSKIEYHSIMSEEIKQEITRLRDQYLLELARFFVIREIFLCTAFIEDDIKRAFNFDDEEIGHTHIDDDIDALESFYCLFLHSRDSMSCLVIPRLADKLDDLINYSKEYMCDRCRRLPVG